MAKDLNTTKQIMLTLGAKEGGWAKKDLDHNLPLNNPFGVNLIDHATGQAKANKSYANLDEAIADWKRLRPYINGIKVPDQFVQALLDHGYNTNKVAYR